MFWISVLIILSTTWAESPLCGETWNSGWALDLEKKQVHKVASQYFKDKYCEPTPPDNANVKFEILSVSHQVLYTKKIYVNEHARAETFDSKTGEISGHIENAKKLTVLIKYPRTTATTSGRRVRFVWLKNNQEIGSHEL